MKNQNQNYNRNHRAARALVPVTKCDGKRYADKWGEIHDAKIRHTLIANGRNGRLGIVQPAVR